MLKSLGVSDVTCIYMRDVTCFYRCDVTHIHVCDMTHLQSPGVRSRASACVTCLVLNSYV